MYMAIEGLPFGTVTWPTSTCIAGVVRELYMICPEITIGFEETCIYDDSKSGSLVIAVDASSAELVAKYVEFRADSGPGVSTPPSGVTGMMVTARVTNSGLSSTVT